MYAELLKIVGYVEPFYPPGEGYWVQSILFFGIRCKGQMENPFSL